jgi:hypothetical protein
MALEKLMVLHCESYVKVLDEPSSGCRVLDDPFWQWWACRMLVFENGSLMEILKNGFWKSYALFFVIRDCSITM